MKSHGDRTWILKLQSYITKCVFRRRLWPPVLPTSLYHQSSNQDLMDLEALISHITESAFVGGHFNMSVSVSASLLSAPLLLLLPSPKRTMATALTSLCILPRIYGTITPHSKMGSSFLGPRSGAITVIVPKTLLQKILKIAELNSLM